MNWIEDFLKPVLIALVVPVTGLASYLAYQLAAWIKAMVDGKRHSNVLVRLNNAVTSAVRSVQQSRTSKMARGVDDKLAESDATAAKIAAVDEARLNLGAHGLSALKAATGHTDAALDLLIGRRVEAAVLELRAGLSPPATAETGPPAPTPPAPTPSVPPKGIV